MVLVLKDRTTTMTATVHQQVATVTECVVFSSWVVLGCGFFLVGATGPSKVTLSCPPPSAKLDAWLWLFSLHCNVTKAAKVAKATEASHGFRGTTSAQGAIVNSEMWLACVTFTVGTQWSAFGVRLGVGEG